MPRRQCTRLQLADDLAWQVQQSQRVCHCRTTFANSPCDVLLRQLELIRQALVGTCLLHRIEVLALQILDECELQRLGIVSISHDHRDSGEAGATCGAKAALAGDELESAGGLADHQRLQKALFSDGGGQLVNRGLVEDLARLKRVGRNGVESKRVRRCVRRWR